MLNDEYFIRKYPCTPHLEGSRLQPGDEDLSQVPFSVIARKHIVVEEKIDGANTGISFGTGFPAEMSISISLCMIMLGAK